MGKKLILALMVLLPCIFADQITKELARQHLSTSLGKAYFHGIFRLKYAENTGTFSSLGAGLSDDAQFWLFTVATAVVLSFLLGYLLISKVITTYPLIYCALIIGGGVSNLIDRVTNDGAVVDFMFVSFAGMRTNIFNMADVAITIGIVLLSLSLLSRGGRRGR